MSTITLMAGTSRSLCRAWHALNELERNRAHPYRACDCPASASSPQKNHGKTNQVR